MYLKKTERNDKGFGKMDKIDLDKELDKFIKKKLMKFLKEYNRSNLLLDKTYHDKVECKGRRSSTLIAS